MELSEFNNFREKLAVIANITIDLQIKIESINEELKSLQDRHSSDFDYLFKYITEQGNS